MPREASKCRGWEKERRNRLNESFASLAKVLPCYDPSVNLSKIDILTKATCAIKELQDELNKVINANSPTENNSTKDNIVEKLKERIRKLIIRNEQLNNLLKDAGISVPKVVSNVKDFTRKPRWSKKIPPKQANVLQKKEMEKENISSKVEQVKKKKVRFANTSPLIKRSVHVNKKSEKANVKNRKIIKSTSPPRLFLLSQPSRLGGLYYFIANKPMTPSAVSFVNNSGPQSRPLMTTTLPFINPTIPPLGPGTFILANGAVMPIISQQQMILSSQPSLVTKPAKISNVNSVNSAKPVVNAKKLVDKTVTAEVKTPTIQPKPCVTKTTQVNKVPIPALTSPYANTFYLLNEAGTKKNSVQEKKLQKAKNIGRAVKRKAVKRKNNGDVEGIGKKRKTDDVCKNVTETDVKNDLKNGSGSNISTASPSKTPVTESLVGEPTACSTTFTSERTVTTSPSGIITITTNTVSDETNSVGVLPVSQSVVNNAKDSQSNCTKEAVPNLQSTEVKSSSTPQRPECDAQQNQKDSNECEPSNMNKSCEGKDDSNECEPSNMNKSCEGKDDNNECEMNKSYEGKDDNNEFEPSNMNKSCKGKDDSNECEMNKSYEGKDDNNECEPCNINKSCEGKDDSNECEASNMNKSCEGKDDSNECEPSNINKLCEGKDDSNECEASNMNKSCEGKDDSNECEASNMNKSCEGKDDSNECEPSNMNKSCQSKDETTTKSPGLCTQNSEVSCGAHSITSPIQEDTIKNLELNLVHSELSNDLFASLQVPPGCQNPESTSPTAAFLLAFPLVSSVKVTDVIDEDNSESHRGTPTLLQIGTIDTTKPTHTDTLTSGLLSLESFSFFNNKDVCGNDYGSYSTPEKKGPGAAGSRPDASSKPATLEVKDNSLRICEQFSVEDMVQALPSNRYSSKVDGDYAKLSKEGDSNVKLNDVFKMTDALHYNLFNEATKSLTKNADDKHAVPDNVNKRSEDVYHTVFTEHPPREKIDNPEAAKRDTVLAEKGDLCQEKNKIKLHTDDNRFAQIITKGNAEESHQYEVFQIKNNQEKTATRNISNILSSNVDSFGYFVSRGNQNNSSKEVSECFTQKNTQATSETISRGLGSDSLERNSESNPKNILNNVPSIYESKSDLSRKNVSSLNIGDLGSSHNNHKNNKNISVNITPQMDKSGGSNFLAVNLKSAEGPYYESFHSKSLNMIEMAQASSRNCEESTGNSKVTDNIPYNLFEITPKELPVSLGDNIEKMVNLRNIDTNFSSKTTVDHHTSKKTEDVCQKKAQKSQQCYYPTSYSDTSCSFNYRTNTSKICPTCSYMNLNKSCPNPLYTNCTNYNYNYPEMNFNQNYYKPPISKNETKSYYSINYENYQEHRKIDSSTFTSRSYGTASSYAKERKTVDKEKCLGPNKPVNWMTAPDNRLQPSEPFLPSFTNQSYSFASCNSEVGDVGGIMEAKKPVNLPLVGEDKQFSWSPTKLPSFLDTTPNFVTPTLPTLVGDLALGTSLTFSEQKPECKYPKEQKRKTAAYENQGNFLSVSQLVDHSKAENAPARTATRRNSGNRSKNTTQVKSKKSPKQESPDKANHIKPLTNNYNVPGTNDAFFEHKNRHLTKSMSSSYSAEALIGNQVSELPKKYSTNSIKPAVSSNFLTENIINYFPSADESYMSQNQNVQNNMHHSFQNNCYSTNSFVPAISSTNFESVGHEYAQDNFGVVANTALKDNKVCSGKNYRPSVKDDKNVVNYSSNAKRSRKKQTYESNNASFDYPLLGIPGSTNSPILPDDFHSHANFLPPAAPYSSKNSFYQRQGGEFNANPLLPLPGLSRNNVQHPEASSMNTAGTSLTNFNLSTIFPEINKGAISNIYPDNRNKGHNTTQQGPFNIDSKYSFSG